MDKALRQFLLALALSLLAAVPGQAATRYVSESGGLFSGGTLCNGKTAISRATFNATTNNPSDVNNMCGILSGSLTPLGSGSAGQPVAITFDSGAKISVSSCGSSGCINLAGNTYYTVQGTTICGFNGTSSTACPTTIESTGTGTGKGNSESLGINLTSSATHIIVQYMGINGMYVHTGSGNDTPGGNYYAISIVGSNDTINNNTIHDAGAGIVMNVTSSSITINNNEIYNCNWSVFGSGSTTVNGITSILVYHNSCHDWQNWDTTSDTFHHDGIFFAGNDNAADTVASVDIYDNYLFGTISDPTVCSGSNNSCMTALIFVNDTNHVRSYNNVLIPNLGGTQSVSNGWIFYWSPGTLQSASLIADNVVLGNVATQSPAQGACIVVRGDASMTLRNNIMQGCANLLWTYTSPTTTFTNLTNNVYQNASLTASWKQDGSTTYNTLGAWQTAISGDSSSQATTSSLKLGSMGQPLSGSIAIGQGANLTSMGFSALNSDFYGSGRPAVAAWDVGAINSATASSPKGFVLIAGGVHEKTNTSAIAGRLCERTDANTGKEMYGFAESVLWARFQRLPGCF